MKKQTVILSLLAVIAVGLFVMWPQKYPEGVTPLMIAAKAGETAEITELVSSGADVNAKSDFHWTALMFAAWQGHSEAVTLLVQAGADINLTSTPVPGSFETTGPYPKTTALSEAIIGHHAGIARYLMRQGAHIDAVSMALAGGLANPQLLQMMIDNGGEVNGISDVEWYRTALSYAANQGNMLNIDWLLQSGADPNLVLPNSTILSSAARGGNASAVAILIEYGANPNQTFGSSKRTVLWQVVQGHADSRLYANNLGIIEILLSNGADQGYLFRNQDLTMIESVERNLDVSEQAMSDPETTAVVQERHRLSALYERSVLNLLRAQY